MQTHSHGYKFVIINIIDVIMVASMTLITTIIIILMKNSSDRLGAELQSDNGGPALWLCWTPDECWNQVAMSLSELEQGRKIFLIWSFQYWRKDTQYFL